MSSLLLWLILGFILLVLFITIDLVYVLWYRRKFRQESTASDDIERSVMSSVFSGNNINNHDDDESFGFGTPPASKELALYYLYWKNEIPSPFGNTNNDSTVITPALAVPAPPPLSPPLIPMTQSPPLIPMPRSPPLFHMPQSPPLFHMPQSPPLFPMPPLPPLPLPPPPPPPVVEDDADDDDNDDDEDVKLDVFRQRLRSRLLQSRRLESSPVVKEEEEEEEEEEGQAQFTSATASPLYTTPTSSPLRPTSNGQIEVHPTVGDWSLSSLVRKQTPA